MLPQLLVLTLALAPNMASAAIFPEGSLVKMIDAKGFKAALKQNMTSVVAFVAPWCGHCQRMAPEYSRAALGLYPLVPLYAVDCDAAANKRLCADQGVKGFPTVKLFPRGKEMKPIEYDSNERTASAFFYWASRAIPTKVKKLPNLEDIPKWAKDNVNKPRALLMNKSNKKPLLWAVLANKYRDQIVFARNRDRQGKNSVKMGFDAGVGPKVLIYPAGETNPMKFDGLMKFDSLSKFFDSVLDGTADLKLVNQEAAREEFVPDPEELEIERRQEAEMLKLAHGGYAEMIDFEAAVKDGNAKNFHEANGYPGMMGAPPNIPYRKDAAKDGEAKSEDATEKGDVSTKNAKTPKTDEAGQIVLDVKTETGQPKTPTPDASETAAETVSAIKLVATDAAVVPEPPVEPSVSAESEPVAVKTPQSTPEAEHVKDEL